MSIKNKIKQRFDGSRNWIMNSPESVVILMLMGTGIGFLFFGTFSVALSFAKNWILVILFGVFSILSLKQFISIFQIVRKAGLKNALGGITASEFVWRRNKNWKKTEGGKEDGNGLESNEVCNESDAKGNGKIGQEVRDIYRQSK